ncbi:MAG: hypothetical protein AAFN18_11840 [Cyanobacteria bacterium J06554_6]
MALYTADPGSYSAAFDLIDALKKKGIEANITVGGVAVHIEPSQMPTAQAVCKEQGARLHAGYSAAQEAVFLNSEDGLSHLGQVTGDAQSVINEWSESP